MQQQTFNIDLKAISLKDFMTCVTSGLYHVLAAPDSPDNVLLEDVWIFTLYAYHKAIGSPEAQKYFETAKSIRILSSKISIVNMLLAEIDACNTIAIDAKEFVVGLKKCLKSMGYKFRFSSESTNQDLAAVRTDIEKASDKLDDLRVTGVCKNKSMKSFTKVLSGLALNVDDTLKLTLSEFISLCQQSGVDIALITLKQKQ